MGFQKWSYPKSYLKQPEKVIIDQWGHSSDLLLKNVAQGASTVNGLVYGNIYGWNLACDLIVWAATGKAYKMRTYESWLIDLISAMINRTCPKSCCWKIAQQLGLLTRLCQRTAEISWLVKWPFLGMAISRSASQGFSLVDGHGKQFFIGSG